MLSVHTLVPAQAPAFVPWPLGAGIWGQGPHPRQVLNQDGVGHPQYHTPALITGKVRVQWGRQAEETSGGWQWEWGLSG